MKYIAAYMLAKLVKENPTIEDLQRIIESVGIEFDHKKGEEIINKLTGKNINEVIEDGKSKLSVVSNGSSSGTDQQTTSHEADQEDSKNNKNKNKKKEEEEETLELGGGFDDLFN
ncbi:Structural constituent of ribosome [Tritrichomonas musculus]|uniref:Structural constituent of ribosome n=1 Tax=Tritrichomonas musculus TaxID=1915356 RepID=A0ABR2KW37_9EUKA